MKKQTNVEKLAGVTYTLVMVGVGLFLTFMGLIGLAILIAIV